MEFVIDREEFLQGLQEQLSVLCEVLNCRSSQ